MEKYLKDSGFNEGEFPNEYVYGSFTVRLTDTEVEVYDEIGENSSNIYWCGENTWENLILVVEQVIDWVDDIK